MLQVISSLCILGEELRYAGPGIDVELFGELQEVLHGDALVRNLLHCGELLLHCEVDALDDEVVGRLLASQHRPLLQKCLAVVVFSQPPKLLEVRLVFPVRRRNIMPVRNITPGVIRYVYQVTISFREVKSKSGD